MKKSRKILIGFGLVATGLAGYYFLAAIKPVSSGQKKPGLAQSGEVKSSSSKHDVSDSVFPNSEAAAGMRVLPAEEGIVSGNGRALNAGRISAIFKNGHFNDFINTLRSQEALNPNASDISNLYGQAIRGYFNGSKNGSLNDLACGLSTCAATFRVWNEEAFGGQIDQAFKSPSSRGYAIVAGYIPKSSDEMEYQVVFSSDPAIRAITTSNF